MGIPRLRSYKGPALLSYGFRPFFLLGSLYAGISILFWLPLYAGHLETYSLLAPLDWHVHEMLFGYLAAIITGFLLTAIPNWTGRLPVQGFPLLGLVVIWIAGRFAVFFSSAIGWQAAATVDAAFLGAVALAAAIEIVAGRNWRNLKVLLPLAMLLAANVCFHLEAHYFGLSDMSRRLGMSAAVLLVMIIGGRIVPSFTRNWLVRQNPGRLPVPFNRFDVVSLAVGALALASWCFFPTSVITAVALGIAAALQSVRLARWAGDRTIKDPLVLVLHLAYGFIPVGFALLAASIVLPESLPVAAGMHALGGGAIGAMTLSVMVRATLGHTGRPLKAGHGAAFLFAAIIAAAGLRIAAVFLPQLHLIEIAGAAWSVAFLGFSALFGKALLQPKLT